MPSLPLAPPLALSAPPPPFHQPVPTAAPSPYQWYHVQEITNLSHWLRTRSCPTPLQPLEPRRHALPCPPRPPRQPPANCCSSSPTSPCPGARVRSPSWPTALRFRLHTGGSKSYCSCVFMVDQSLLFEMCITFQLPNIKQK